MTRFTNSPYEMMMTQKPTGRIKKSCPSPLPQNHPCYGCGNYTGQPCVGICQRELNQWLKERKRKK